MIARKIMNRDVQSAHIGETIRDVLALMRVERLRMLPVLDADERVVGVISTFTVMEKIMPRYIVDGDLESVSYAPDMGLLSHHYAEIACRPVADVMDENPLMVRPEDSLFAVTSALIHYGKHEFALVTDEDHHLLGIISAGDILNVLNDSGDASSHE